MLPVSHVCCRKRKWVFLPHNRYDEQTCCVAYRVVEGKVCYCCLYFRSRSKKVPPTQTKSLQAWAWSSDQATLTAFSTLQAAQKLLRTLARAHEGPGNTSARLHAHHFARKVQMHGSRHHHGSMRARTARGIRVPSVVEDSNLHRGLPRNPYEAE